jgi:2-oxoglutarate dehydrogenase E2 component (dihydrolipoamide succinyltransferase)
MGESIFEGTITRWLKQPGDAVSKDEPLFEISTDKVDAEIPSPAAGTLTEILFPEGETVQVNTVVARIGEPSEAPGPTPAASAAPSEPQTTAAQTSTGQADGTQTANAAAPATPSSSTPPSSQSEPATPASSSPASTTPPAPESASEGATEVVMPQMGESIFEGTITRWLKQPGDTVSKDEPLFEISTDKVDAEIPSPAAGILTEIRSHEGETVQVNTVVALIGGKSAAKAEEDKPAAPKASLSKTQATQAPAPTTVSKPPAPAQQEAPAPAATVRSSPLVRRIARENSLDLTQIPGTGSNGRITKQDALAYLASGAKQPARTQQPTTPAPANPASANPSPATPSPLLGQLVPLSRMRSIIAQRMVESRRISPHVHTVFKIDMTRISRLRERERARFEQQHGVKLTYMPFIASAVTQTLTQFPVVNASLESTPNGDAIRYHQHINLGIAVSLEWGLIVPVIHQAESKSFPALAQSVADLALRARTKRLNPEEVQGSTFTLTNSGIFGEEFGFPIINQPNSAILAIGALKKEPVVLTDAEGNDTIAIRSMQHFCLGFDHRTIDGADAGKFMAEFKSNLENWPAQIS